MENVPLRFWNADKKEWINPEFVTIDKNGTFKYENFEIKVDRYLFKDSDGIDCFENDIISHDVPAHYTGMEVEICS